MIIIIDIVATKTAKHEHTTQIGILRIIIAEEEVVELVHHHSVEGDVVILLPLLNIDDALGRLQDVKPIRYLPHEIVVIEGQIIHHLLEVVDRFHDLRHEIEGMIRHRQDLETTRERLPFFVLVD
jgi:hypothetical protein